jgi:hypothetical protein
MIQYICLGSPILVESQEYKKKTNKQQILIKKHPFIPLGDNNDGLVQILDGLVKLVVEPEGHTQVVVGLSNPPAVSWQGALNTQGETAESNLSWRISATPRW